MSKKDERIVKKERTTRIDETRVLEERRHELEAALKMGWVDPHSIPSYMIPEGMEYGWVRTSVFNEPDTGRLPEAMRKGWSIVPADRHPDRYFTDPFGRNDVYSGHIFHKGAILCERPTELGNIERRAIAERNYQELTQMPGTENFLGEPTMAGNLKQETSFSRAASFGK